MPDRYRVTATGLNLRSAPEVTLSTRVATLPEGQIVTKLATAPEPEWWRVSADLNGVRFDGFVNSRYLAPADDESEEIVANVPLPEAHLTPKSLIRRDQAHGRAYPLNEPGQPRRNGVSADSLATIIDWLAVEQHQRYLPVGGATYCNIYAHDYCYLGAGFLPRVWWTNKALQRLAAGETVQSLYDSTVRELNANSLYDWLGEYGPSFDWRRVGDLGELQDSANTGRLAIICAKRKDLNRSGHIVAVVPETANASAIREGGSVRIPVQSQAGGTNFRYGAKKWWTAEKFSAFGFWVLA
jgi:hypothetical protein